MCSSKDIGKRIVARLEEIEMTQRELGRRCGVSEVSVSRYVQGNRFPRGAVLSDMAKALGVTTDWLITGEDSTIIVDAVDSEFRWTKATIEKFAGVWTEEQRYELIDAIVKGYRKSKGL